MPDRESLSMATLNRQVLLFPVEGGWWCAEVPSLPGCVTQGRTQEDALENAKEAIQGYIESLVKHGDPVPEDRLDSRLVTV